jgi:hypothetical protein
LTLNVTTHTLVVVKSGSRAGDALLSGRHGANVENRMRWYFPEKALGYPVVKLFF